MVPSSSGLGRGPLKAATRVQIPLGSPMPALSKNMKVLFLYAGFELYGFFNSDYKCCFTSHCSFATTSLIASPHKKCITALFLSAVSWDHQLKQQAEKCLLFLFFPNLSTSSNLCFLKTAILGNFTNSFMQKSLFFNILSEFESRLSLGRQHI